VSDDGDVVSGGTTDRTTVTGLLLNVGNDGTFGHGAEGENVSDVDGGLLSGVDELTGVHALVGDETVNSHNPSAQIPHQTTKASTKQLQAKNLEWEVVRLMAELVAVRVAEDDLGKRSTSTRVVDDVLYDTANVSMALGVVEGSEFGRVLEIASKASVSGLSSKPTTKPLDIKNRPFAAWCWP
jgi:hypothetical protein